MVSPERLESLEVARPALGSLGFACQWGRDRAATWSGTPWRLRAALAELRPVVDLDASVPPVARQVMRLAYARRSGGRWHSKWAHGRPAERVSERRLQLAVRALDPSVVVEIGDLGCIDRPYFLVQDLSYDLLLEHFGDRGVPHFRTLSRRQIRRLRDRQAEVFAKASGLFPMSRWLAERTVAGGVERSRVHVVNPGVNAPLAPDDPIPLRRRGPQRRLLFLGRDFETKAGSQVLAAFAMLRRESGRAISLTVAGPPRWPMRGSPPDGVQYLGAVSGARVQDLYDSHDLFVMPSRFEGFGIAFVEALVRGLPCVGRDACAMPEIIRPHDGGYLIRSDEPAELAETISTALDDDLLYQRCAEAVSWRRRHFTWKRAAAEVIAAVERTEELADD